MGRRGRTAIYEILAARIVEADLENGIASVPFPSRLHSELLKRYALRYGIRDVYRHVVLARLALASFALLDRCGRPLTRRRVWCDGRGTGPCGQALPHLDGQPGGHWSA